MTETKKCEFNPTLICGRPSSPDKLDCLLCGLSGFITSITDLLNHFGDVQKVSLWDAHDCYMYGLRVRKSERVLRNCVKKYFPEKAGMMGEKATPQIFEVLFGNSDEKKAKEFRV